MSVSCRLNGKMFSLQGLARVLDLVVFSFVDDISTVSP